MKLSTTCCFILCCFAWSSLLAQTPLPKSLPSSQSHGFLENVGQVHDQNGQTRTDIDFKYQDEGVQVFVGNGQLHYQWLRTINKTMPPAAVNNGSRFARMLPKMDSLEGARIDMILEGANPKAIPETLAPQQDYETYYLTQYGLDGALAHKYCRILYRDIYPHIDWELYEKNGQLEYDFIVHPGGDPSMIRLHYAGADSLTLRNGAILANTSLGKLQEAAPIAYSLENHNSVAVRWVQNKNELRLETGNYQGTLVIDPVLDWATYYGGSTINRFSDLATDTNGNLYISGITQAGNDIATIGAFQTFFGGGYADGMIVKFNPYGARLWATLYGGIGIDNCIKIACNPAGDIYTIGQTTSTTIATQGSFQATYPTNASEMSFLAKFSSSGSRLWSTYYGNESINIWSLTVSNSGSVYIGGEATSPSLNIATPGSYQPYMNSGNDAFVAKFNNAGNQIWATYYGGDTSEVIYNLKVDNWGNLYFEGDTKSHTGIATANSFQPSYGGGLEDGFLAKMDTLGINRIWATYYGGDSTESSGGLSLTNNGDIYLCGVTKSNNQLSSLNAFQTFNPGNYGGFLARFDSSGNRKWGTYFGGNGGIQGITSTSLTYNQQNNMLYISGSSYISAYNMVTANAQQPNFIAPFSGQYQENGYLEQFDTSGQRLYGTWLGGGNATYIYNHGCSLGLTHYDPIFHRLYLGGNMGTDSIATPGAYQTSVNLSTTNVIYRGFLMCFIDQVGSFEAPNAATAFCVGQHFLVQNNIVGTFLSPNTFNAELSDATGSFANPVIIGTVDTAVSSPISCTIPANTIPGTNYRIHITASNPAAISIDNGANIHIYALAPQPIVAITASPDTNITSGTTVLFQATVTNGGSSPSYQWYKNGVVINGATNSTYSTNSLQDNDQIKLMVHSSIICATPPDDTSNSLHIHTTSSINNINAADGLEIYPNPVNHQLHCVTTLSGQFIIRGMDGKLIATYLLQKGNNTLSLPDKLASGIYLYTIVANNGVLYQGKISVMNE